jgi:hypothetical protein
MLSAKATETSRRKAGLQQPHRGYHRRGAPSDLRPKACSFLKLSLNIPEFPFFSLSFSIESSQPFKAFQPVNVGMGAKSPENDERRQHGHGT